MSEHGIEYIGHLLPAHLVAYQVLAATGYGERARKILAKAHALLTERADRLDDVEFRRSFLDNVAAHREIVMEWEKARPLPVSDRFP
jgi:hypothetical protein